MKSQQLYRGSDNKKVKLSKVEKVFKDVQARERRAKALADQAKDK